MVSVKDIILLVWRVPHIEGLDKSVREQ